MIKEYKTKQREFLLEFLKANAVNHFTAEDIYKYALTNDNALSQTTVYRTLEKLSAEGVVMKYTIPNSSSAFYFYPEKNNANNEKQDLSYLICSSCGDIAELNCGIVRDFCEHIREEHNFSFEKQKAVFYGCCKNCNIEQKRL